MCDTLPPGPVTLPVHCVHCGGAVTLQMSDWPTVLSHDGSSPVPEDHPGLQKASWGYPWCQRENEGGFPGRLAWVTKGHDPDAQA